MAGRSSQGEQEDSGVASGTKEHVVAMKGQGEGHLTICCWTGFSQTNTSGS